MEKKKRILIVDDERSYAEALKERLAFEGYEVDVAPDGEAGLEAMRRTRFDLVLLDLMMPRVNGFDLIEAVRSEGEHMAEVPILVVTAYGDLFSEEKRKAIGEVHVFLKPYNIKKFLKKIEEMMS
jgi:DNA-binding response OmpR family regulator